MKTITKKDANTKKINKEGIKKRAVSSLRSSFEFEGIVFTDEEIQQMVAEVRSKRKKAS